MRALAIGGALGLAGAALALVLGACSSDSFTTPDGGDDGSTDRNTPPDASDGGADAPVDAPPKSWCATNSVGATACADFDGVDAAAALAPTWSTSSFGNTSFAVGAAPSAKPSDASTPSAPNQIGATIGVSDAGVGVLSLSATGITNASSVRLDFDFRRPSTEAANQAVEFATVEVQNSNPLDAVVLRFVLEGSSWHAEGNIAGGIVGFVTDPIGYDEWHRVSLRLSSAGYGIYVDGKLYPTGLLSKPWPSNGASYGRLGANELRSFTTAQTAWFDNVVWQSN